MRSYFKKIKEGWRGANKRKIAKSGALILLVIAAAIGATYSYFQDEEISTGNKFVAGKLNLKIENTCHYNGMVCSENKVWAEEEVGSAADPELLGTACECTWSAKDLAGEMYFNFLDVKPGDNGEDTVSLHVDNNDAWVCAEIANLKNFDNSCDSPENKVDTSCGNPGEGEGELQNSLYFSVWKDNGAGANACNNVKDADEAYLVENQAAKSNFWPIADSTTGGVPIEGGETTCFGIAWNVPIETSNVIQTDSLTGDVIFKAIQARNMKNFKCSDLYVEICDDIDNNYNSLIDEGALWANKGQACSAGVGACSAQGSYICDTNNPARATICSATAGNPSDEACDEIDNDCDGQIDEDGVCAVCGNGIVEGTEQCDDGNPSNYDFCNNNCENIPDNDGDGFAGNDCNDNNANIYPDAPEYCNGIDENCNGYADDAPQDYVFVYRDADNDGFGNPLNTLSCRTPGYVENDTDCDDTKAAVHPGATETCNGTDDDCDGQIDESFAQQGQLCSFQACAMLNGQQICTPVASEYQCVNGAIYCGPSN